MSRSITFYVLAVIQLISACSTTRSWFKTGDGVDLLLAVIFVLLAIVVAITGYRVRNSPAPASSDPRILRRIASVGGVTGTIALIGLLWRVHGQWVLLGETLNLVLALVVISGFVCAVFGALFLKEQRTP